MFRKIINTDSSKATILIRLLIGTVFLPEGIQKFLYPDALGASRFSEIGFANPSFWASFTGCFEIICGIFILSGFLTRLASIPLLIIMLVAFISTKYPFLLIKVFGKWHMDTEQILL